MQTASSFTREFVPILFGPLIWAAHFLAIYIFAALACARRFAHLEWLGAGIVHWFIGAATVVAIVCIAGFLRRFVSYAVNNDRRFAGHTAAALGFLSTVAILWETTPAYIFPACT